MGSNFFEAEDTSSDVELNLPVPRIRQLGDQLSELELAQPPRPKKPLPFLFEREIYMPVPQRGFVTFKPVEDHRALFSHTHWQNNFPYNRGPQLIHKPIPIRLSQQARDPITAEAQMSDSLTTESTKKIEEHLSSFDEPMGLQSGAVATAEAPISTGPLVKRRNSTHN